MVQQSLGSCLRNRRSRARSKNGGYTPHDLRHAATREVNAGFGRGTARDFIGHKDDRTARHYDGAAPEQIRQVAQERLNRRPDLASPVDVRTQTPGREMSRPAEA